MRKLLAEVIAKLGVKVHVEPAVNPSVLGSNPRGPTNLTFLHYAPNRLALGPK